MRAGEVQRSSVCVVLTMYVHGCSHIGFWYTLLIWSYVDRIHVMWWYAYCVYMVIMMSQCISPGLFAACQACCCITTLQQKCCLGIRLDMLWQHQAPATDMHTIMAPLCQKYVEPQRQDACTRDKKAAKA